MAYYNFKKITVVPTSKDFTDVVLSKTQRKTPTQIHRHFKVRILNLKQHTYRKVSPFYIAYHSLMTNGKKDDSSTPKKPPNFLHLHIFKHGTLFLCLHASTCIHFVTLRVPELYNYAHGW